VQEALELPDTEPLDEERIVPNTDESAVTVDGTILSYDHSLKALRADVKYWLVIISLLRQDIQLDKTSLMHKVENLTYVTQDLQLLTLVME
jgi:hypothetical protein